MHFNPIGDLASSFLLRNRGNSLRSELVALTQEIASGQKRDIAASSRENLPTISAVEHSIKVHEGFEIARQNVGQVLDFASSALTGIYETTRDIGPALLGNVAGEIGSDPIIAEAPGLLADVISYANTRSGSRYVFAGTASDQVPVADAEIILADLTTAVSGTTNTTDYFAAIDDWFSDPGAGYSVAGYQGGAQRTDQIDISANQTVGFSHTANDAVFRDTMKHLATIALVDNGTFPGGDDERADILKSAAEGMASVGLDLIKTQAEIGTQQARIEQAATQSDTEVLMFEALRNDILSVDPFETATRLEEVQTQLESLYLVTARASRLSLSEYLR